MSRKITDLVATLKHLLTHTKCVCMNTRYCLFKSVSKYITLNVYGYGHVWARAHQTIIPKYISTFGKYYHGVELCVWCNKLKNVYST